MRFMMIMFPKGYENAKPGWTTLSRTTGSRTQPGDWMSRFHKERNDSMRILRTTIIAAAAFALTLPVAFAQDQPNAMKAAAPAKKAKPAAKAAMPAPPKPGPEMEKLVKALAGNWSAAEHFEVSEMMPQGGAGTGSDTLKAGPGGFSLIGDYRLHTSVGNFTGHAVTYWDAKQQAYLSLWCDSMGPDCENGVLGKWEGDNLVFTFSGEIGGQKYSKKQTFSEIKPDSFLFTIDWAMGGGEMKPFLHIKYTRKAAMKPAAAASAPARQ